MNINQKWKQILALAGIQGRSEVEVDEGMLDAIDQGLAIQALRIEELEAADTADQIDQLQKRIVYLETENARFNAKSTLILPKEDPAPSAIEVKTSSNQTAYEEDVRNFAK